MNIDHANIKISVEPALSVEDVRFVLIASGVGERRPARDLSRLELVLRNADLIVAARSGGDLIGIPTLV